MSFMSNIAIIPARGGSKRIPRKNIKDFLGRPIIVYSIEAALKSQLFDEVMVSTDDDEIAKIAVKYGAKVPFLRSAETSTDFATTMEVIQEVVSEYKIQFGKVFDLVCCIYPTAPLIQMKHLKKGLDLLLEKDFGSVFPVVVFGYPVWRGVEITADGKTQMVWPEYINFRSQDLKKVYHDAGQWYWMRMNQSLKIIFTQNSGSIVLSETEVQDIDNLIDWDLAEMKYKLLNEV
jgi:pseudaminic acid cytidylyltransferase